jgi:hypothetical protein
MEHVNKALELKPWAAALPLQLVIDKPAHKFSVNLRSLIRSNFIHWHGSPVAEIAKDLTHSELIEFVNNELNHPKVEGWRVYGGGSPSGYGLRVGEFNKPHLSDRELARLEIDFLKAGGL